MPTALKVALQPLEEKVEEMEVLVAGGEVLHLGIVQEKLQGNNVGN